MTPVLGTARVMVVGALLLVACGGGVSREDYAESYSKALCHRQARCGEIRDEDACVRNAREFARIQRKQGQSAYFQFEESMEAGRLRFDEDAADDCVQRLRDGKCDEVLEARNGDICDVLAGQQKDGEPCASTEECGQASYCDGLTNVACKAGTCKPRPGLGQPATAAQVCASGLVVVSGICQARSEEGGPCTDTSSRCAPGLYCDFGAGVCRRFAGEGEACSNNAGPECLSHLTCTGGSCHRLLDVGADCRTVLTSPDIDGGRCKADLFCENPDLTGLGICRERVGPGASCSRNVCQTNFFCDTAHEAATLTCQTYRQPGESCAGLPCGPGSICNDETRVCDRLGRLGDPCPADIEPWLPCIGGLECRSGKCEPVFGGFCAALN